MSLNFVAIDIETANPKWDTICAVSLQKVCNGVITDSYTSLINPECDFSPINSRMHGITAEKVVDAPTFPQAADKIIDFIGSEILVSHNISFDGNVLQRTFNRYNIDFPKMNIFCSLICARAIHPDFENHKLPTLCKSYGIPFDGHHNSEADAYGCASLLIAMADETNSDSISDLANALDISIGYIDRSDVRLPALPNAAELMRRAQEEKAIKKARLEKEAAERRALREAERIEKKRLNEIEKLERQAEREKKRIEKEARKAAEMAAKGNAPKGSPKRPILQMSDDGTIIKRFDSIASAMQETGINAKSIRDAANGIQKHAGGYCWAFDSQDTVTSVML